MTFAVGIAFAQPETEIPRHFDARDSVALPDLSGMPRIRFLTTTDFPPFNFLDRDGRLAGFNIELVREICAVLKVAERCEIQALPWSEITEAMENGSGEAIVAGLAVTDENRLRYRFSRRYLELPARFVALSGSSFEDEDAAEAFAGKRVGVMQATAHEAMLQLYFPAIDVVAFTSQPLMRAALKSGNVAAIFGDGMELSFWLASAPAADCCIFVDGPFFSDHFLGHGLAIAVAPDNGRLAQAIDHALLVLSQNGRLAEIYLRTFPNGLY